LFTCLLLVALVVPACQPGGKPPTGNVIKVGVIGPMEYIQGRHNWLGAQMAAEEINAAGGVKVGADTYQIQCIKADSNEINSTVDASSAMEKLITIDKADFVMGGFRTEAVFPMQEVAMDNHEIFLDCGAATLALCTPVLTNYDRYKYFFRVTPFASPYLVNNTLMEVAMAGAILKEETGIQRKLRVAICAEGLEWADSMVKIMENLTPLKLGMEVSGTWRPSATATELTAEMTAIEAANTDIICPIISGPLGIPYARSWGELQVPAASVGINVEAQAGGFWEATNGLGNYDTGLSSYAKDVVITPLTLPFFNKFVAESGEVPTYNAGTYDAMYILKGAIERAGTLDADAVVVELEKTDQPGTVAVEFKFTGMDAPDKNPHDVVYGPGFSTGLSSQWQDGQLVAVWPNPAYGDAYVAAGFPASWKDVKYGGIVKWQAPPRAIEKLKAEAATEEAAPAAPSTEEGAAPPAEGAFATYTNSEYGFSLQYPSDWVERPEIMITPNYLAAFGVSGFVPGVTVTVFDNPPAEDASWIKKSFQELQSTMPKVTSDITNETLPGDIPAYTYTASYISSTGYEIAAKVLDADKDGKRFRVNVFTIEEFAPMDPTLASEIIHSLTFK
jgi:branched-chain amino acid transport system substrate-binding protein